MDGDSKSKMEDLEEYAEGMGGHVGWKLKSGCKPEPHLLP